MCFFSAPKQAAPAALPPPPDPAPTPVAADPNPQASADQKRQAIANLKRGMASTILTSPQGITGKGPDLSTPNASGMFPSMGKTTTGS